MVERRKILRSIGEAIEELQNKNWVHLDIKPDNILVNWASNGEDAKIVTNVVLGDFDIAFKSDGQPLSTRFALGNVMWRSPEGQTGRGITKASDIFSFGLVCIYTLGGGDFLLLDKKSNVIPEQEILFRHFSYFGPASEGLLNLINDETWCAALKETSDDAVSAAEAEPEMNFQHWGRDLGDDLLAMVCDMVHPDPSTRLTIDQILSNQWWQKDI